MATKEAQELLNQLLSDDLSGVTFVRDYLQLQFHAPPTINVYSRCRLTVGNESVEFGDERFANLIIAQIGKIVVEVSEINGSHLLIRFADHSRLQIPFDEGSFEGPEAIYFIGRNDQWGVWPA